MSTEKIKSWKRGRVPHRVRLYLSSETWKEIERRAQAEEREDIYLIAKALEKSFSSGGESDENAKG